MHITHVSTHGITLELDLMHWSVATTAMHIMEWVILGPGWVVRILGFRVSLRPHH
jgi:hypothetical protein